jgi:hypothetical protein
MSVKAILIHDYCSSESPKASAHDQHMGIGLDAIWACRRAANSVPTSPAKIFVKLVAQMISVACPLEPL